MLENGEIELFHHSPVYFGKSRLARHWVNQLLTVSTKHRLFDSLLPDNGSLPLIGAHHIQENRSDVLHPLMQTGTGIL